MANKCHYERRRTLVERLNNWKVRNDSTNVSLLLSGDHLDDSKKTKRREKKSPCKTCYCRKSPVLSKFNMKSNGNSEGYKSPCIISEYSPVTPSGPPVALQGINHRRSLDQNSPKSHPVSPVESLQSLGTFRKDNYFECHSSTNLDDVRVDDHKCIHKFVLNNRLIPQPLNADIFGTSRCVRCNKPLEIKAEVERRNYQSKIQNERRKGNTINITNESGITEIQIPANFNKLLDLFQDTVNNISKTKPTNTLALRHQKGVVLN